MGSTIRRLLRRPLTILGIVLVVVHLVVALTAPAIVPLTRSSCSTRRSSRLVVSTGWGPTNSAAISCRAC